MKRLFAKLIIFALFLTAPLSFTGDRCPDFKPDCVRSNYAEKARAATVAEQRVTAGRRVCRRVPPRSQEDRDDYGDLPQIRPLCQAPIEPSLGRAPPCTPLASA